MGPIRRRISVFEIKSKELIIRTLNSATCIEKHPIESILKSTNIMESHWSQNIRMIEFSYNLGKTLFKNRIDSLCWGYNSGLPPFPITSLSRGSVSLLPPFPTALCLHCLCSNCARCT